jgi:hypothetical protein
MSQQLKLFSFLALLWVHNIALANVREFYVEVIAFKQSAPNSEIFAQTETEIDSVKRYAARIQGIKTMNPVYLRLKKSEKYTPFYYSSRQVQAKSWRKSRPVKIDNAQHQLKGWIKIQRGDVLHVLVDVELSSSESGEEGGLIYHLKEKRRVLLKEVHYFDHPEFGLIVKVSPI